MSLFDAIKKSQELANKGGVSNAGALIAKQPEDVGLTPIQASKTETPPVVPAKPVNLLAAALGGVKPGNALVPAKNPLAEALKTTSPLAGVLTTKPTSQKEDAIHDEQKIIDAEFEEAFDETDENDGEEPSEAILMGVGAEEFNHSSQPNKYTTEEVQEFEQAFEILKGNFDYPDQIGQSIAHCMVMLRDKPYLKDLLKEENATALIEGLRIGYGTAITTKKVAANKKATKSAQVDDFTAELQRLGVNGLGQLKL